MEVYAVRRRQLAAQDRAHAAVKAQAVVVDSPLGPILTGVLKRMPK